MPANHVGPSREQPGKRHLLRRGLVAQTGAGHGARTAARHAVLLAVQEAAEASVARGRAPGGALPGDVPGRANSAITVITVTRAHPRANARD
ncbi:hypothetical protein THAOC_24963 [Thalassiosira oceanica]|uniref:Uncharacterized protein n=1 Tax=Thalassiosira oceanica TaxID=159749 RepID=K0RQG3_THAOC|nr:hypothetical protein THAOC_24963 [Thalassiosira oceanica]|eukprot:EJK55315.1 hypothetical protein THAOC_24963 [Thalassiosira oceanica]